MNIIKSYMVGIAAVGAMAFTGCNMDVDPVPVNIPEAVNTPNTTILELKEKFWSDETNYIYGMAQDPEAEPAYIPAMDNGDHYIIHGRVCSNDDAGNVFKSLVIQDETAALAFSINTYDLYVNYRVGQEIVVDVTGMQIGKYNGLLQMGQAEWYENGSVWEASFMPLEVFRSHVELNGLPQASLVDTIQVNTFSELASDADGLRKWQSQLVKLNNVHFEEGGKELFSEYQSSGVSRKLIDSEGSEIVVRTSGYSDFWNMTLPEGDGDVVCILGYYGTTGWQLTLIDYAGCMNFGNPTIAPGGKDNPYTVEEAIEVEANGRKATGWVTGYIVGTVAPEVTSIASSSDVEWGAEATLANTMVIGPDPDCKDVAKCLVMSLPQGSKLREVGALRDNPEVYQRQIWVYGTLDSYLGNWGITDNKGTVDQFRIDGVVIDGGEIPDGDGASSETPYNVGQVIAMNPSSTTVAEESGVWVKGYIVGYMPTGGSSTLLSGTVFAADADAATTNIVIGPTPDCTDATKCVGIQLPTAMRSELALANAPGNLGKPLAVKGDVMKYCGGPGVKNITEKVFDGGGETPTPPEVTAIYSSLSESDQALPDGWTVDNSTIWVWKVYNGSGYLNGSGYINNAATAAEAYAVSPVIDLAGTTAPSLTFDHAAKFQTTLKQLCGVCARVEGTTEWTMLQIPTWPVADAWTFVNSGNVDLSAFAGKRIQIAFKYGSTAVGADTWEIKNLKVLGEGGQGGSVVDPNPPTPPVTTGVVTVLASDLTVPGTTSTGGYTFDIEKAAGTTNPAINGEVVRLYADNTLKVSGDKLTKIVFTLASTGDNRYTTMACSTGSITPVQAMGDTEFTWVGDATEVTFTVGHDATLGSAGASSRGQIHFSKLEIYGDDSVTPPAGGGVVSFIAQSSWATTPETKDGVTVEIKAEGGTAPAWHAGTSAIRAYSKNTINVSGKTMTKIIITLASDAGFRYTTVTPSTGSISPAQAVGDTSFTWEGNASEVTFTVGDYATMGSDGATKAGQIRFTGVDVTTAE